jgi:hypothetical protein
MLGGDAMVNNQFLYRAVAAALDEPELSASNAAVVAGPFTVQAEEYCFGIEAVSITTGIAYPYPDLELCAPHGELADFVERNIQVTDETLNRFSCMVPPAGYEERWCEANAQCIELWRSPQLVQSNNCQLYFESCPDAERPDGGTAGTTMDAGGAGSAGGLRDAGFAPWSEPEDAGVESDASDDNGAAGDGSSCAVARRTGGSLASPVAGVAFAVLALLRVRRRGPVRRAS